MTDMALPLCLFLEVDSCAAKRQVSRPIFRNQQAAGILSNKQALCESPSYWLGSSYLDPPCDMLSLARLCRPGKRNTFSALRQSSQNSYSFSCKQYFTKKDGLDQRFSTFLIWNLRIQETSSPKNYLNAQIRSVLFAETFQISKTRISELEI